MFDLIGEGYGLSGPGVRDRSDWAFVMIVVVRLYIELIHEIRIYISVFPFSVLLVYQKVRFRTTDHTLSIVMTIVFLVSHRSISVPADNAAFIVIITTMQGIFITAASVSLVLLVDCTIPIIFMFPPFLGNLFLDQRFQQATEFCMQANEEVLVANNLSQTARLGHIRQWRGG